PPDLRGQPRDRIQPQPAVPAQRTAVLARVRASGVRSDRPTPRQPRPGRHPLDGRALPRLVEGHPVRAAHRRAPFDRGTLVTDVHQREGMPTHANKQNTYSTAAASGTPRADVIQHRPPTPTPLL